MSDIAQKIISNNAINNGRATIYVPGRPAQAQWGGWSGILGTVPLDPTALEARYRNRFDESVDVDTINTFTSTSNLISTTEVPISGFAEGMQNIRLKAAAGNTGTIFVGPSPVTTTNGFPLAAGQEVAYPINQTGVIYAIAIGVSQRLHITTY